MAKIGLNYGEKLQIADKTYRVITDGLNVPEVLGKLSFRGIEGPDIIFEEDRTQRNPDGSFVQVNTGEIRGIVVAIHSSIQHETLFFTIADMAQSEIEDLGIKYREEVELEDIVITQSPVGMPGRAIVNPFLEKITAMKEHGEKAKISHCYQCLEHCDPANIPYCITKALSNAAEGALNDALLFCGSNAYRADKIETVEAVVQDLVGTV